MFHGLNIFYSTLKYTRTQEPSFFTKRGRELEKVKFTQHHIYATSHLRDITFTRHHIYATSHLRDITFTPKNKTNFLVIIRNSEHLYSSN